MGAVVALEPKAVAATPGVPTTATIRVRNSGSVVDQFTFEVLGDARPWTTVEPAALSLFPGAEGTANLTFAPPRASQPRAGQVPFAVRAASKEDPGGSVVEEGTVDVAPFSNVFVELVPKTSRGSRGATHDIAVDNRGNIALNAALDASDADRLLRFEVRPPVVDAEAGTAAFAKVGVKPIRTFWRGPAQTRPFKLNVDVPDGPPVVVDGSLLQTAILPSWAIPAASAALALLIAATVLWLTVLQPAIQATARQQANDVLAAVGITPPPSAGSGAGGASPSPSGSGSAGSSASPAASGSAAPSTGTASPTPTLPATVGGATPADGRLTPGAMAAPTAGKSLYITDLVFSNPSSTATGEIRLERSGEVLLSFQLQNFRDLDFHFVTPIVVADGQQLTLSCPTGCSGSAVFYSGYQH
ncbi:MAG TPA: hypothetical protein VKR30_02680 [Candidatus Limnocylindrales bacterium]|nr:hypothetical protein [Candidatus Limnocylindrales bacterium]